MSSFIKKQYLPIVIAFLIVLCFFYKSVLHQQIPFPGDLLVNQNPYKTESFLGYAPGGYPNMAQGMDVITELFPWKYFTIQELKAGRIPFWNPHNFTGNVHMQNYQTGVFYPFNLLFFIFSFTTAWTLFIMLQPLLGILFMYLFLRNLSLGKITALIGGVAFAFSSYMTVWMEYGNICSTIIWLPFILFCLQKFIEKQKVVYFLLTLLAFTCSFLAGYIQGVFYIYIIAFFYTVFICKSQKIKNMQLLIALCLLFILPICFSAFQIITTFDVFRLSTRGQYSLSQIENLLNPLYYWVTIFIPDFFGNPAHRNYFLPITYIERVMYLGIPLLFFIFLAIANVKKGIVRFFLILGLFFLLITTNLPLIKYVYLLPIPMISTTVPTRALSMFIFCMIIVGCFGMQYWIDQKNILKSKTPFIFIGIYVMLLGSVFLFAQFLPNGAANKSVMFHNSIFSFLIAIVTIGIFYCKKFSLKISFCLLLLLTSLDLFIFFQKITPFAPQSLVYPKTPVMSYLQSHAGINRFWGYGGGYIAPNFQTYDGTYSPEGNDPLHRKEYGTLLASSGDGKSPDVLPRPDANIAPAFLSGDMKNPYRQKILNLLGIKYVLSQGDSLSDSNYKLLWDKEPWKIYENTQAYPRYFLASQYVVASNSKDILSKIYSQDLRHIVILGRKPISNIDSKATGTVSLLSYDPDGVSFKTTTTGNSLLFLSDDYFYSWKGQIDNNPVPIYQADMTFRAIEVPKGTHIVSFIYSSVHFPVGLKIALVSLGFCILYCLYFYRYVEKK